MESTPIARAIAIGKVGSEDSGSIPDAARRLSSCICRHRARILWTPALQFRDLITNKLRLTRQRE
jgi:hypothetical protein